MPKKAKPFIVPYTIGQQIKYRKKSWVIFLTRIYDPNDYYYKITDANKDLYIQHTKHCVLELNGRITQTNLKLAIDYRDDHIEDDTW